MRIAQAGRELIMRGFGFADRIKTIFKKIGQKL